jgi:hypothetical protein
MYTLKRSKLDTFLRYLFLIAVTLFFLFPFLDSALLL